MKNVKIISGLVLAALSTLSGAASAATITFGTGTALAATVFGEANATPRDAAGDCANPNGDCYYEAGFAVGIVQDLSPGGSGDHLHRAGLSSNRTLQYHADSSGIYVRAIDGSAFSFNSTDFHAPISDTAVPPNPNVGADQYWEILGFNQAEVPNLYAGDGTSYPGYQVAYQQVLNGTDVNGLVISSAFQNIKSFWIHYVGYPALPTDGVDFAMTIDNINLGAPVVGAVPIPAAVWLFGSGLMGLVSFARRKSGNAA